MSAVSDQLILSPLDSLPRPESRLAIKPTVRSIDDAELAFREIAWCNAVAADVLGQAERIIATIHDQAAEMSCYQHGEEMVPVAFRRGLLEQALLTWADENRAELCPGRLKKKELVNGVLKWRAGKDSVARLEGVDAKEAKAMIGELPIDEPITIEPGPLVVALQRVLDALGFGGVISVGVDLNKTAATKAYAVKQITVEQLESIGHTPVPGEEYVTAEPAAFVREGV